MNGVRRGPGTESGQRNRDSLNAVEGLRLHQTLIKHRLVTKTLRVVFSADCRHLEKLLSGDIRDLVFDQPITAHVSLQWRKGRGQINRRAHVTQLRTRILGWPDTVLHGLSPHLQALFQG